MALQLVVCLVALLWLLHRATSLLKISAPTLIQILGIDIPESPKVSIDAVTDTKVSLHWNPPEKASSVVKYVLEIDGKKAGETDRSDFNVTVKDLEPGRQYSLTILAVNPNNYRSHSKPIRVRTKKTADECLPEGVQLGIRDDSQKGPRSRVSSRNLSAGLRNRKRAGTANGGSHNNNDENNDGDVYSVEQLTGEVELIQIEINDLLLQASQNDKEFADNESVLLEQLEKLRERKKIDDTQRAQIRSEAKSLEDSKRSLENQRTRVDRRYKQILEEDQRKSKTREKWIQEIEEARAKVAGFDANIYNLNVDSEERVKDLKTQIKDCQRDISNTEEVVKKITSSNRKSESKKSSTMEAIQAIRDTESRNGVITDQDLEQILSNDDIDEDVKKSLREETKIEQKLEEDWRKIQKELEMRYLDVKTRYEKAGTEYREAQNLLERSRTQPMRNSNVVLESLTNAIPGRRKNRKRSTSSAGATTSQPAYPIYERTTQASSSSMLPNLSTASTSSSNQFQDPSSTVSLAPPSIAPISSATSGGASANNSARVSIDTSYEIPPHQSLINDGEHIQSPSVDMLLPSGLLGADDLTDSFASLLKESKDETNNRNFSSTSNSMTSNQRRSGAILGQALHTKASTSFDATTSPKPSVLSLQSEGSMSPAAIPSSPQSSFGGFPMFQRNGTTYSTGSIPPPDEPQQEQNQQQIQSQEPQQSSAAKKFSFFFNRQSRRGASNDTDPVSGPNGSALANGNDMDEMLMNNRGHLDSLSVHSGGEIAPIGFSRARAGSYSSVNSRFGPSSGILNPWLDQATGENNSLLMPSRSNNGSILSYDSSRFGIVGSHTDLDSRLDNRLWSFGGSNNTNNDAEPYEASHQAPQLLVNNEPPLFDSGQSVDSRSSGGAGGSGNAGSKFFSALFSSSPSSDKEPREKMEKEKSIPSLFGKSDDETDGAGISTSVTKENMFQKSMRAFTPNRKSSSSSSTTSGKFKVRSLFGGKKGDMTKEEDSNAITEESELDEEDDDDYDDDDDDHYHDHHDENNAIGDSEYGGDPRDDVANNNPSVAAENNREQVIS